MVMVHGLMVAGSCVEAILSKIVGSRGWLSRAEHRGVSSNVVGTQAGYLARPTTLRLKRKFIVQTTGLGPFRCPAYAPSPAENGQVGRS